MKTVAVQAKCKLTAIVVVDYLGSHNVVFIRRAGPGRARLVGLLQQTGEPSRSSEPDCLVSG